MQMSKHAEEMSQQRGVTGEVMELHQQHSDQDAFVGSGLISRTLTERAFREMVESGVTVQLAEKVRRLAIVYSGSGDMVITVLQMRHGKAKIYTRGNWKRSDGRPARRSKEKLRRQYHG